MGECSTSGRKGPGPAKGGAASLTPSRNRHLPAARMAVTGSRGNPKGYALNGTAAEGNRLEWMIRRARESGGESRAPFKARRQAIGPPSEASFVAMPFPRDGE